MNLRGGCCCCYDERCRSGGPRSSSSDESLENEDIIGPQLREEEGKFSALHPSRRKRRSLLRRSSLLPQLSSPLVFIVSAVLLTLHLDVSSSTELPTNSNNNYLLNGGGGGGGVVGGESTPVPYGSELPSVPSGASSSLNNVFVPGPSSPAATSPSSVTQSYFINGYANSIQRTNVSDLRNLAGNKQFQLWFRTKCPFGNIVNDDKFALRINGEGYLSFLVLPQEAQSTRSQNRVADGQWHSVTFVGSQVFLDDRTVGEPAGEIDNNAAVSIQWDHSNETDHKLYFFDGFVGCIRLEVPANNTASSSTSPLDSTPASSSQSSSSDESFVLYKLFKNKVLQKYQPCNDDNFDLDFAKCFSPESFVLCSKCENNAKCKFTDSTNECECPQEENVVYHPPYCSTSPPEPDNGSFAEGVGPESREFHAELGDEVEPVVSSSTARSSRTSLLAQQQQSSSSLMSSTTEQFAAAPSSIEESNCTCLHGGSCIPAPEDPNRICNCTGTGFRGRTCANDVCDEMPGVCGNFGRCFDDPTSASGYECYCKPGFSGTDCTINFDECLSNPCRNNGSCEDKVNTYKCHCQPGYEGKDCEKEINECEPNPCIRGTCEDKIADYNCTCERGYEGKDCEIDINECAAAPCENNGTCNDNIGYYECDCADTGFEGPNCTQNVDDCSPNPCRHGGNCTDGIKEYTCDCYAGYEGVNCEVDVKECDASPCLNYGSCYEKSDPSNYGQVSGLESLHFDYSIAAGYVCVCEPGYEGENCETDIDECLLQGKYSNPCNSRGNCIDEVNGYRCDCHKGFEGDDCGIDINECEPNPCDKASECKDKAGDYECDCNPGYGGKNCTVALTGCITNVCNNDGSCTPSYDESTNTHHFKCKCKDGFTGDTCSTRTTMGFNGSSMVEIVKNDAAYENNKYFLSFAFRTTLRDVVLAVGQGGTYFSLVLSGGTLNLQSSLINNLQGMSSGRNLSDGEWHKVVVSINSSHVILSGGNEQVTLPIADSEDLPQQTTGFYLTILGNINNLGFLNKHEQIPFVGCMQDVMINDERILPENRDNVNLTHIVPACNRKPQCAPNNPCQNGGSCTDLWQTFTCACPRPHLGERCQHAYIAATFNNENQQNSLATVDIPSGVFSGAFDISMFVRTREHRGTIFLLCDKDRGLNGSYIEASVTNNGYLVVQAKWTGQSDATGSGSPDEIAAKPEPYSVDGFIADGGRHLISVQRDYKGFVIIKLNGSEHFRKSQSNKGFSPNVMYIGGKPASLSAAEFSPLAIATQEGHSGETSTSFPDTPIDNNTEGTGSSEADGGGSMMEVLVPEAFRFKGEIQDVRVNLSSSESSSTTSRRDKFQNVYIVEFFNLTEIHEMRNPLGRVTTQNLLNGTVSDDHCKSSPCHNSGECENTWNDFRCNCNLQYSGKHCEVRLRCADVTCPERSTCKNIDHTGFECKADASFDGSGYTTPHYILRTSVPAADLSFNEIKFQYRSKKPGNLFHISNISSYIRVSLEAHEDSDAIVFHFSNESNLVFKNATIFDGDWHSVELRFETVDRPLSLIYDKLSLENETFLYKSGQYLKDMVLSPNMDIVVGSSLAVSNEPDHTHNTFYRGCLREIYIGSQMLPFISQAKLEAANERIVNRSLIERTAPTAFYINERHHGASEEYLPRLGCLLCYEKDCLNGGKCLSPTGSYDCNCAAGFNGDFCEVNIDECIDNLCMHESTCMDSTNNYTCVCNKGWNGWLCDQNIDECALDEGVEKCSSNGECQDGIGEYTCKCYEDFTGAHCEKRKKSNCGDEPCENGANCEDVGPQSNGVSFHCTCGPGWEGEFCTERIDYCKEVHCLNDGECVNGVHGADCRCSPGFDGPRCEVNIDECSPNPCRNNGSCVDGINLFSCDCTGTGFEGMICDEDVDECQEPGSCDSHHICENIVGSFLCSCPDKSMCGPTCSIENPCFTPENITCLNGGVCEPKCDDPDPELSYPFCKCLPEYSGERCETHSPLLMPAGNDGPIDILLIIIPVLAAILIAATVGIIILVRMARRKRATRGVYSPSQQEYCNPRVELDNVMKPPPEERLI